jgi:hypothetical protein
MLEEGLKHHPQGIDDITAGVDQIASLKLVTWLGIDQLLCQAA